MPALRECVVFGRARSMILSSVAVGTGRLGCGWHRAHQVQALAWRQIKGGRGDQADPVLPPGVDPAHPPRTVDHLERAGLAVRPHVGQLHSDAS